MNIIEAIDQRRPFETKLSEIKSRIADEVRPGWYPYPTLSVFEHLDKLLHGENRTILRILREEAVLDLGAGDGSVAFFLESLGAVVDAVDNPRTNYNGMTGIRALQAALGSSIRLYEMDLDSQFKLTCDRYGLTCMFGLLYHLKNPFFVLEQVARQSRYCLMSTRITRRSPDGRLNLDAAPLAYLLDERETNNDPTNYWVFSETGLKRLIHRAGWDLCEFMTSGAKSKSDPVHADSDERAFCLMRSRIADFSRDVELGEGWYALEEQLERWTARVFNVVLPIPRDHSNTELVLKFYLPEVIVESLKKLTLRAEVNGVALALLAFHRAGEHVYGAPVPPEALRGERVEVRFELDRGFSFDQDRRELGVLVSFARRSPIALVRSTAL